MTVKIFVNYRRGDDPGFARALFGQLELAFAPDQLFMDVDSIAPGLDFVSVLDEQVAQCDVLFAVVGRGWLNARDGSGQRRLDDADDFVRIEIASALRQGKRVIPVLVNDAPMPRLADLPAPLKQLARCNAVRLTHERFRADTQGLIKALNDVVNPPAVPPVDALKARLADNEPLQQDAASVINASTNPAKLAAAPKSQTLVRNRPLAEHMPARDLAGPSRLPASFFPLILICSLVAPYAFDPYVADFAAILQPPTSNHYAGTDTYGRDVLARVLLGLRLTTLISAGAVALVIPFQRMLPMRTYSFILTTSLLICGVEAFVALAHLIGEPAASLGSMTLFGGDAPWMIFAAAAALLTTALTASLTGNLIRSRLFR